MESAVIWDLRREWGILCLLLWEWGIAERCGARTNGDDPDLSEPQATARQLASRARPHSLFRFYAFGYVL